MSLEIKNLASSKPELMLYGDIGVADDEVSAAMLRESLDRIDKRTAIALHIHSEGGNYYEAIAMHSVLKQRAGGVDVVIDGIAASAASIVAMAGRMIYISRHAWLMCHEIHSFGRVPGLSVAEMRAFLEREIALMEAGNEQLVAIYAARWKGGQDDLRARLKNEIWLRDEQAVAAGLADEVLGSLSIAASISGLEFKNVPDELRQSTYIRDREARLEAALELNETRTFPREEQSDAV